MNKTLRIILLVSCIASIGCVIGIGHQETKTCTLVKVTDGDTFRCDIAGWPDIVGKNMPVRLKGVDTPELQDKRPEVKKLAYKAKEFTKNKLTNAGQIRLANITRGKYFRLVADVIVDGNDLGKMLIKSGLARPYGGKKK